MTENPLPSHLIFRQTILNRLIGGSVYLLMTFGLITLPFNLYASKSQDVTLWILALFVLVLVIPVTSLKALSLVLGWEKAILDDTTLTITDFWGTTTGPHNLHAGGTFKESYMPVLTATSMGVKVASVEINGKHVNIPDLASGTYNLREVVGKLISQGNMRSLV